MTVQGLYLKFKPVLAPSGTVTGAHSLLSRNTDQNRETSERCTRNDFVPSSFLWTSS